MPDVCDRCGLKPWDAEDLQPGGLVCVCDDLAELEPDFVLGQYMPIDAFGGDYTPLSLLTCPWQVAVWLEYGRRGGIAPDELAAYRALVAEHATAGQVEQVLRVGALLEALTVAGDHEGVGAYLAALGTP